MNSKIAVSALSIMASLAVMGGATFAYFSDAGTSTNNVFASGSFNLKLTDDNQAALDDVSETWTGTNMAPGGTAVTATLNLKNTGTVAGNNVHLKAGNTLTDTGVVEDLGSMAKHLKITGMTYGAVDILPLFTDTNGNSQIDLEDLQSGGDGVQIGALSDLNVDHPLVMSIQLDSTANNTYQGDQVVTIFTATLHQDASQ